MIHRLTLCAYKVWEAQIDLGNSDDGAEVCIESVI